jgi:pimeloyl-ACP methyl ester carboxylesterase
MARISVNNITLAYEVMGKGPPIVWTPGAHFPRDNFVYQLAGRFSTNHKVLIWDRRNAEGASDITIEDAPSDWHLWTDDLHHLLNALNMSPACVAGASSGHILSLLMAHRYPEDVQAIILYDTPTDNLDLKKALADAVYLQFADVAERKGMQAVIEHSTEAWVRLVSSKSDIEGFDWAIKRFAETILMNPSNRDRLLSMEPKRFASIMRKYSDWVLSGRFHLSGLSDEELGRITAPALVLHGFDDVHPRDTAEELHRLLPNSEWVEYSDLYTQEVIDQVRESDNIFTEKATLSMPSIEEFLQRIESKGEE